MRVLSIGFFMGGFDVFQGDLPISGGADGATVAQDRNPSARSGPGHGQVPLLEMVTRRLACSLLPVLKSRLHDEAGPHSGHEVNVQLRKMGMGEGRHLVCPLSLVVAKGWHREAKQGPIGAV